MAARGLESGRRARAAGSLRGAGRRRSGAGATALLRPDARLLLPAGRLLRADLRLSAAPGLLRLRAPGSPATATGGGLQRGLRPAAARALLLGRTAPLGARDRPEDQQPGRDPRW